VSHPVKESAAQLLLQLFDLHGDRGLGITQLFAGFGETAKLRYVNKRVEIFDIHNFPPTIKNFNGIHRKDLFDKYMLLL
jgi:hypothetical protein